MYYMYDDKNIIQPKTHLSCLYTYTDFRVRWADGAVLRYSLRSGRLDLLVRNPAVSSSRQQGAGEEQERRGEGVRRHCWDMKDGEGWMAASCAAGAVGKYLGQAQQAMMRYVSLYG